MRSKTVFLFISFLLSFLVAESFCRLLFGKRLVMHYEKSGLYYFEPNQHGWYLLGYPPAKINNIGARGDNLDVKNMRERGKVVFLGDSVTFGWLLADNETIPHIFGEAMNLGPQEVVNLANGGFGIDHMKEMYLYHQNLFAKGDKIIVILMKFDLFNRPLEPYKGNLLKEAFWKVRSYSSFISWSYVVLKNMGLHLKHAYEKASHSPDESSSEQSGGPMTLASFERTLSELSGLVKRNDQKMILVFYEYEKSAYSDLAGRYCNKHNFHCITDVWRYAKDLKERGNAIYLGDHVHPTAVMNQAVGKAIAQFVKQKGY